MLFVPNASDMQAYSNGFCLIVSYFYILFERFPKQTAGAGQDQFLPMVGHSVHKTSSWHLHHGR